MTVYTYTYEYNTQKMYYYLDFSNIILTHCMYHVHNPFPNSPLFFIINVHNKTVGNYKNALFIKFFYQRVPAIQKSPCFGQTDSKVRDHVYKIKCQVTTTSVTSFPPPPSRYTIKTSIFGRKYLGTNFIKPKEEDKTVKKNKKHSRHVYTV